MTKKDAYLIYLAFAVFAAMGNQKSAENSESNTNNVTFISRISDNDGHTTSADARMIGSIADIPHASKTFEGDNHQVYNYNNDHLDQPEAKTVNNMGDNKPAMTLASTKCSAKDIVISSHFAANVYGEYDKSPGFTPKIRAECASKMFSQ